VSWRAWLTTSSTALRTDRGLALAAGFAALLAAVVAAATLVTKTPLSGIETLAFPMLMVGQLWTIGILNARLPQPAGGWWARWTAQVRAQQDPRTFLSAGFRPWPPMP
jgi:hypothetical protein